MDCILFNHPSVPISSNVHHHNIVRVGQHYCRKRAFFPNLNNSSTTCWAVFDENENGSAFETLLSAEITPETIDFFVSETEGDPDRPTKGYSSIGEALNGLRQGKVGGIFSLFWSSSEFLFDCGLFKYCVCWCMAKDF